MVKMMDSGVSYVQTNKKEFAGNRLWVFRQQAAGLGGMNSGSYRTFG